MKLTLKLEISIDPSLLCQAQRLIQQLQQLEKIERTTTTTRCAANNDTLEKTTVSKNEGLSSEEIDNLPTDELVILVYSLLEDKRYYFSKRELVNSILEYYVKNKYLTLKQDIALRTAAKCVEMKSNYEDNEGNEDNENNEVMMILNPRRTNLLGWASLHNVPVS